jgi:nitroreductase
MEVIEAILKRRSFRGSFEEKPISQADLDLILEAARWAPSPFNVQPWEILVITEPAEKRKLSELVAASVEAQFKDNKFISEVADWMRLTEAEWSEKGDGVLIYDQIKLPKLVSGNMLRPLFQKSKYLEFLGKLGAGKLPAKDLANQVKESPLILIILMNQDRRPPGENGETWMFLGLGAMIQNILLASTSLGIGVQFVSAPLETESDRKKLTLVFSIPENRQPISILRLGYAKNEPNRSVRLKTSEFVKYEKYL